MRCLGRNKPDHCCWLNGKVCAFLEENSEPGYRWSCGLRRELGSWDAVLADPRYRSQVHPEFIKRSKRLKTPVINCRDWPSGDENCQYCGANA